MTCNDVEMAIIQGGEAISAEVASHLQQCSECRAFASLQQSLLANPPTASPSLSVDHRIMAAAEHRLQRRFPGVFSNWPRTILAVAAAVVLVAVLAGLLWLRSGEQPAVAGRSVADSPPPLSAWTVAVLDLEMIDTEIEAALAELSMDPMTLNRGAALDVESESGWDALLELEFDVYFEAELLKVDG